MRFNLKLFVGSVLIAVFFPHAILSIGPENLRRAKLIEKAPRQAVTVMSKWTTTISPSAKGYWIRFKEPVAKPQEVQITSEEYNSVPFGGSINIAVLPDGTPHTLNSGANAAFEQTMQVFGILLWLAAMAYLIAVIYCWIRPMIRGQ